MSVHRASDSRPDARPKVDPSEANAAPKAPARTRKAPPSATPRTPVSAPRSSEEAEERYVMARDAWIAAMGKANSGRSADLASLGIAQEAYEQATVEVEVPVRARGCKNPCPNCGTVYPLGDCSD